MVTTILQTTKKAEKTVWELSTFSHTLESYFNIECEANWEIICPK
jgi:hypothetical protein